MKPKREYRPIKGYSDSANQLSDRSREYIFNFKGDETKHTIIISLQNGWYTGTIKFSKPLFDIVTQLQSNGNSTSSRDLQIVKDNIRVFLKRFGDYEIKP